MTPVNRIYLAGFIPNGIGINPVDRCHINIPARPGIGINALAPGASEFISIVIY